MSLTDENGQRAVKKVGDGRGFVVAVFRPHAELSMQSICKLHLIGTCEAGLLPAGTPQVNAESKAGTLIA